MARVFIEGAAYHVLNRGNNRSDIFRKPQDYQSFMSMMGETQQREPARILAYCLMPNHWHFVFYPARAGEISAYMRLLMNLHVRRYHKHYGTTGFGHIYQGRSKSFPIQSGRYLLNVLRYVEGNAVRARIVDDARLWPWASLIGSGRSHGGPETAKPPIDVPDKWIEIVNTSLSKPELHDIRRSVDRGSPYGDVEWTARVIDVHGLGFTLRPRGRPRNGDTHLFTDSEKR